MREIFYLEDGDVHSMDVPKHHVNSDDMLDVYDIEEFFTKRKDAVAAANELLRIERASDSANIARAWYRKRRIGLPKELHKI